jgi:hypothetical protein
MLPEAKMVGTFVTGHGWNPSLMDGPREERNSESWIPVESVIWLHLKLIELD